MMKTSVCERDGRGAWSSATAALFAFGALAAAVDRPAFAADPPDLTRGADVDRTRTYNLGATGMRGWIHTRAATYFDGVQGRTTTASRQILVTHVGSGTPADGVVAVGDVILGVNGAPFTDDARRGIAVAIQEAESEAGGGTLRLVRWRGGRTEEARFVLPMLGTYSTTAPEACPKSHRILDAACVALSREPFEENLWGAVAGLAMLASGKDEFRPRIEALAHAIARGAPDAVLADMRTWECGYRGIFLCEYHLLTGDREVLPAIETITRALARGQGMYGTFGHGFAEAAASGGTHGPIPPYGPVNAAGLPANLAIVLGRECGVADPEVAAAIDRGSRFFAFYVDKGSIPYGEHAPFPYHENNGKNSLAAVFFSLQGNRPREAAFFARMATAGYRNREYGHTGQGFGHLWCCPGVSVAGPEALAAYFREVAWQLDLARRSDGSFAYDGADEYGPGSTEDDTYLGRSTYYGLSPTATAVLTYATPLRTLRITGRGADAAQRLPSEEIAAAVAAGRFDSDLVKLPFERLIAALGDWSPVVRRWAAEELARRPEAAAAIQQLMTLAEGPDPHIRQGACDALGLVKAPEAVPVLVRLLVHDDRWLRVKAAAALKAMGAVARPAVPGMLEALSRGAEPAEPIVWADPIQLAQGELAAALFNGLLSDSIEGVDRGLLHPAIRAVSRNADGMARATLVHILEDRLTVGDVEALGTDILAAATVPCPADTMFRNEIRLAAVRALAKYRFREGIDAAVSLARTQGGHGSEERTGQIMKLLEGYGAAARGTLPQLESLADFFRAEAAAGRFPEGALNERRIADVRRAIATIEASTVAPAIRSLPRSP